MKFSVGVTLVLGQTSRAAAFAGKNLFVGDEEDNKRKAAPPNNADETILFSPLQAQDSSEKNEGILLRGGAASSGGSLIEKKSEEDAYGPSVLKNDTTASKQQLQNDASVSSKQQKNPPQDAADIGILALELEESTRDLRGGVGGQGPRDETGKNTDPLGECISACTKECRATKQKKEIGLCSRNCMTDCTVPSAAPS